MMLSFGYLDQFLSYSHDSYFIFMSSLDSGA